VHYAGLVALSPNSDDNYLAYLASSVSGEIIVFDALNLQVRPPHGPIRSYRDTVTM
jgi:hypothetical protein